MPRYLRELNKLALFVLFVLLALTPARAQTNGSQTFGANLGSLNYTAYTYSTRCSGDPNPYNVTHYYNFVYVSPPLLSTGQPINQSLGVDAYFYYLNGRFYGQGSCPTSDSQGFTYYGNGYDITVNPIPQGPNATITVSGYINPKYLVVGILYAPPGHKSSVDYTNSDLVSSTVTIKNTLQTSYTLTNTTLLSFDLGKLLGWKNGSIDGSVSPSESWTQSTTTIDSTAVTVQKTTGTSLTVPGPLCDYCGIDHDYDQIAVWLNPVQLFTLIGNGSSSKVQPNGYGFSTYDQPGTDIYYVYVGELNGDFAMRSSTTTAFNRSWASGFLPSGQNPALTTQDLQTILQMDPYWNCTYQSPVGATACAEPPNPTFYTEVSNDSFPYQQPIPGGQPDQKTYTFTYTNTDSYGVDVTQMSSQSYSLETSFGFNVFGFGLTDTTKQTWAVTHTYETSDQFTSSNTSSAQAPITGPACAVSNGACSPVYPPANAFNPVTCTALQLLPTAFGQGDNMYIYQDNLFGSFMFEPYGQP